MFKIFIGVFLIAHGLVHGALAVAPNPADPDAKPGAFFTASERSWLLPQFGLSTSTIRWIGITLVALSTLGFVLAGLGVFGVLGLDAIWRTVAVLSSFVSLLLLLLFWYRWLPVGVFIDVGILIAILWANWPPVDPIGA